MSDDDTVVPAFQLYADASSKFDYFVTGGAGAVLAYSLERFDPAVLPIAQFLAPVAWALLMASLAGGLTHLHASVAVLKVGAQENEVAARLRRMRELLAESTTGGIYELTSGEKLTREQAIRRTESLQLALSKGDTLVKGLQRKGLAAYRVRNIGLLAGFGALALWKGMNLFTG